METAEWPQTVPPPYKLERGYCNYRHPDMAVGKSNGTNKDYLKYANTIFK